jgi:hypothetical protein
MDVLHQSWALLMSGMIKPFASIKIVRIRALSVVVGVAFAQRIVRPLCAIPPRLRLRSAFDSAQPSINWLEMFMQEVYSLSIGLT